MVTERASVTAMNSISPTRYRIRLTDFLITLISVSASIVFLLVNDKDYCNSMVILPVLFGLCYIVFAAPLIHVKRSKTLLIFTVCEFLRCVFLPVFVAFSEYSGFYAYSTDDKELILDAVLLMSWEMIVLFVFLYIYVRNQDLRVEEKREVKLEEKKYAIYLLIIIGIVIYFAVPSLRYYISFFAINADTDKVRDINAGGMSTIFTGLMNYVHIAFLCIFILILDSWSNRFDAFRKQRYIWGCLVIGLLTIAVIFGESRAAIVYTLFAVLMCMHLKYPEFKKRINAILVIGAVAVLLGMTIYRLFAVYNYGSYSDALTSGRSLRANYFSDFFEAYLLGPQAMASGIEFKERFAGSFGLERLLYDLFRPFMGFNLLLQRGNVETSITTYNSWLSGIAGRSNGYFLQITAQGYCYFGFFFAPVFAGLFMWLSLIIEKWMNKTKNLFVFFFLNYVFIRTSTCVLGGTMSGYITSTTMTLLVCGAFYLMQKVIVFRRKGIDSK